MISFATIEKITENTVKIYLDMYPEMCSTHARRKWKKPFIVYDDLTYIKRFIPNITEGDVLLVEHCDDSIIFYLEKDDEEKQKRAQHLAKLYQHFHH